MTPPRRSSRFLALLLSVALALPWAGPAYALRASSESAHAGLEQALQSTAGLEEITTVDQLLARFPRLLVPGPRAHAKGRSRTREQLQQYYNQFFQNPEVRRAGVDLALAAHLLLEMEEAEADVARRLPTFPRPPFETAELVYDHTDWGWAGVYPHNNLHINTTSGREWLAVAPFLLRHELGERILDEERAYRRAEAAARSGKPSWDLRREYVLAGWPSHRFLTIPSWLETVPRPHPLPWLLAPEMGARVWDVAADAIALRLVEDHPKTRRKVVQSLRAFLEMDRHPVAQHVRRWVVGGSLLHFTPHLIGDLGTLAVAEAAAEAIRAHGEVAAFHRAATHAAKVLDHDELRDKSRERVSWGLAYRRMATHYRTIARDLQFRPAGLEEVAAAFGLRDSRRIQVIGPSALGLHPALAGLAGQAPAVLVPLRYREGQRSPETIMALAQRVPRQAIRVDFYGTDAEYGLFLQTLDPTIPRDFVEFQALGGTTFPQTVAMLLRRLQAPTQVYEPRFADLLEAVATLASQV